LSIRQNEKIRELVDSARRRFFFNVAVAQGVLAASVAMAGAILILIFGNQFLDWRWLALIAAVTFPVAYFRTARRVPSAYRVAQIVDDRLALRDSLSTALYFSESAGGRNVSESMRLAQLEESERISRQVDPTAAVPLSAPRVLYVFGALFLAALALFALRYGFERSIDLKKPLARILLDALSGGFEQRAALNKQKKGGKNPWDQRTPASLSPDDNDPEAQGKLDEAPASVLDTIEVPDVNNEGAKEAGGKSKGKGSSEAEGERSAEEAAESESAQGSSNAKDSDQSGSKQGETSAGKQTPNSNAENSSLASKIKDAMSNLLASMRPQNAGANQQPTPGQNGPQKSQQAKGDQKGSMGQGQKKGGEQSSDSQDGQSSDDADSGKSAEGKSSGKSSDDQASHNPGSGIGKQDGAKDAKLAEQLAAMGKISEIIGKRSANVTGEVTIEVNSSKQQLKTPYSDSKAAHGESGGEINRDEVPVAFQQYVQQYFEQVRKQGAPAKGAGKSPSPAPNNSPAAPSVPPPSQ
jgi:hypothetical protein